MNTLRISMSLFLGLTLLLSLGCAKAPVTGRSQINFISRSEELAMGKEAAKEVFQSAHVCRDPSHTAAVRRVGQAIAKQANVEDANWSFNCIEDNEFNALCLPGGIIFVNSGVFRYVENDDQLAGIIGHEVGHALARHGAENLSRGRLASAAVLVLSVGVGAVTQSAQAGSDMASVLNTTALYAFSLPGSRAQEYEADKLGLTLMAKAGYDPVQFPQLWSRLIDQGVIKNTRDFAKTHPADAKRLEAMYAYLPEARRLAGLPPAQGTNVAQAQPAAGGDSTSSQDPTQAQDPAQTPAMASSLTSTGQDPKTAGQDAQPAADQTPSPSPGQPGQDTAASVTPDQETAPDQPQAASAQEQDDEPAASPTRAKRGKRSAKASPTNFNREKAATNERKQSANQPLEGEPVMGELTD